VKDLEKDAGALVESFTYRDRMEGIPIHDEQGSHDRPHDLTVTFDRVKIDAALTSLGLQPWRDERPTLVVVLGVTNGDKSFVLSGDGERKDDMGASLANASFRTNMPALLPSEAVLTVLRPKAATVASISRDGLGIFVLATGADRALAGTLTFSDAEHGWLTHWRIFDDAGLAHEWHQRGVSFDDAFRNALRGAAQVLSGHGTPD
jgi:hypothetical protein